MWEGHRRAQSVSALGEARLGDERSKGAFRRWQVAEGRLCVGRWVAHALVPPVQQELMSAF